MTTVLTYKRKSDTQFVLDNLNKIIREQSHKDTSRTKKVDNEAFIFGGYVRDTLRSTPYTDMDICIPNNFVAQQFIEFLNDAGRLIETIIYKIT